MRLIADGLNEQSRTLKARARSKAYSGPALAIARAPAAAGNRLAWLARELVVVRREDRDRLTIFNSGGYEICRRLARRCDVPGS
jgi:hypothetical protein